jgi:hypothetical protein
LLFVIDRSRHQLSTKLITNNLCSAPVYSAPSSSSTVWETTVVPTYTTYCPEATKVTYGSSIWTVTEATTLTLTSVTVTVPVYSSVITVSSTWYAGRQRIIV